MLYYIILYDIILFYIILYYMILYEKMLYCIIFFVYFMIYYLIRVYNDVLCSEPQPVGFGNVGAVNEGSHFGLLT